MHNTVAAYNQTQLSCALCTITTLCSCRVKQNLYCGTSNKRDILALDLHAAAAGNTDVNPVEGQKTATGAQKETFGTGSSAQSEAGKKGGAISGESLNVGSSLPPLQFVAMVPRQTGADPWRILPLYQP